MARSGEGRLPALLAPDPKAARRVIEFFTAHIRNPNTRKAYAQAPIGNKATPTLSPSTGTKYMAAGSSMKCSQGPAAWE